MILLGHSKSTRSLQNLSKGKSFRAFYMLPVAALQRDCLTFAVDSFVRDVNSVSKGQENYDASICFNGTNVECRKFLEDSVKKHSAGKRTKCPPTCRGRELCEKLDQTIETVQFSNASRRMENFLKGAMRDSTIFTAVMPSKLLESGRCPLL